MLEKVEGRKVISKVITVKVEGQKMASNEPGGEGRTNFTNIKLVLYPKGSGETLK